MLLGTSIISLGPGEAVQGEKVSGGLKGHPTQGAVLAGFCEQRGMSKVAYPAFHPMKRHVTHHPLVTFLIPIT